MDSITVHISEGIQICNVWDAVVVTDTVADAVNMLKDLKADGDIGLMFNHMKQAPRKLLDQLQNY